MSRERFHKPAGRASASQGRRRLDMVNHESAVGMPDLGEHRMAIDVHFETI
jgi:hypothetical protein